MNATALFRTRSVVALQTVAVMLILTALPLYPPASGRQLLIPLGAESSATLLPRIFASGARLVDRGPIAGSFVIDGARPALTGVIALAAPQGGCGTAGQRRR